MSLAMHEFNALATNRLVAASREGWSLEQSFYTDPGIHQLDLERVFCRGWLFAGPACRIPNPGDYFTYSIGKDSLILIRGDDGAVRALFNVCRHRGSQICTQESGHIQKLVCPYHQWVYEKDGTLGAARFMESSFDRSNFGLHPAAIRVVEGLIFVSFASDPPSFDLAEEQIRAHLGPYELENTKVGYSTTYLVAANWKLIAGNFRECYHCTVGHPQYCRTVIGSSPFESMRPGYRGREVVLDRVEHWRRNGLETGKVDFEEGDWFHCSRYPFRPGYVCESLDGAPVAPLLGRLTDRDAGVFAFVGLPAFWLEASGDYVWLMRVTPRSATVCDVETSWLVRADAHEGVDYDLDRVIGFWKLTGEQDWKLCEDNQAGVNSSRYQPGPYSTVESGVAEFDRWYLRRLAG